MQGYSRRQLKEDKFAETAQGAAAWAAGHRSTTIGSVVAGVLVILAIIGFVTWRSRQSEQGNIALASAIRTFDTPLSPAGIPSTPGAPVFTNVVDRAKAGEKAFKAVADSYSYTGPARMARYMEGVAALQAGDNAGAEAILKTAGDSGDQEISALAKLSLAELYRSINRAADAAKIYKDLADHPTATVPKTRAQLSMAEMYESSAPDQAAAIYQQIQKDNPKSVAAQIAGAKLSGCKPGPGTPSF